MVIANLMRADWARFVGKMHSLVANLLNIYLNTKIVDKRKHTNLLYNPSNSVKNLRI